MTAKVPESNHPKATPVEPRLPVSPPPPPNQRTSI